MDTYIPRKRNKYKYFLIGSIAFILLVVIAYSSFTKKSSFNVNRSEIIIKSVEHKSFEDFISFQAKIEPLNSVFLNIIEGGAVQEIFVENGDMVKEGQPLVQLNNPISELGYMTQETSIIEQINNLNKAELDLRNQELNMAKELALIDHDYQNAKNEYDLNKQLFEEDILAENEWTKTQENFRYQEERKKIIQESIKKEKQANEIQLKQMKRSIATMNKSLEVLRSNKKNFLVSAPVSGRLSSFEPILGKTYQASESIGKIDVMEGYKLVAEVDEFYLDRIAVNMTGSIEHRGEQLDIIVAKVMPEIKNGQFQAELHFVNDPKIEFQQGFSYGVRLTLSEESKSLVISKGSFQRETAGKWIFVVNGDKAERRDIKLGRENPLYFEVISGLEEGEQIITSNYADYTKAEILNLK